MICFRISIFEPLKTTKVVNSLIDGVLWFAFELVSLNHWKQPSADMQFLESVVICFRISIFEPLKTTIPLPRHQRCWLWFAFELVSLNHWKQPRGSFRLVSRVVICFRISIFEPLKTTNPWQRSSVPKLWFAFELVSLNHWKQLTAANKNIFACCDLLSN